jgi:hypothetical protein
MTYHTPTPDEQRAAELAHYLDQGQYTAADNPELGRLLQTFAQLQDTIEEPESAYFQQLSMTLIGEVPVNDRPTKKWQLRLPRPQWSWRRPAWLPWRPAWNRPVLAVSALLLLLVFTNSFLGGNYRAAPDSGRYRLADGDIAPLATYGLNEPSFLDNLTGLFRYDARQATTTANPTDSEAGTNQPGDSPADGTIETVSRLQDNRLIQQEAWLVLVAADVAATQADIERITTDRGGYIVNLNASETPSGHPQATISVRVPAESFSATLRQLKALGLELREEQISSQDVTSDYVDLESRLRNLQLAEAEIGEVLASARERGESSANILRVYDDLNQVREQIEQIRGQMQLLEHTTSTSLITVTVVAKEVAEEPKPGDFNAGRIVNEAWVNLIGILQRLSAILIWAGIHSPLLLVPLALILLTRRLRRRS